MMTLYLWPLLAIVVVSLDASCFFEQQQQLHQPDDELACLQLSVRSVLHSQEYLLKPEVNGTTGARTAVSDLIQVNDSAHVESEKDNGLAANVNCTGEKKVSQHIIANGTVLVSKDSPVNASVKSTDEKRISKDIPVKGTIAEEGSKSENVTGDDVAGDAADPTLSPLQETIEETITEEFDEAKEGYAEAVVKRLEEGHVAARKYVVPFASCAFITFIAAAVMERYHVEIVPEAAVMILVGMFLGMFFKKFGSFSPFGTEAFLNSNLTTILMMGLLPIIIFASGWTLRRQDFLSQFPYILLFAVVGVLLSMVVIACCMVWTGSLGFHPVKSFRTAFAYATLLSATDPVSCLVVYQKLKVDPLLNILVYGEATINDAVAIVLFHVFNRDDYMEGGGSNFSLLANMAHGLVVIFCGSSGIGFLSACLCTFIARWTRLHSNKKYKILVITAACYLTYGVAESFGMSGIIANLFFGIFSGIYMRPLLSQEGSLMATFFLSELALLADAAVFVLVGFCVVELTTKEFQFSLLILVFCLVGRFLSVFPVAWLVNHLKNARGEATGVPKSGRHLLSVELTVMIWHAGLRGGIAVALSLQLGHWVDKLDGTGTLKMLQTGTFTLVCVFLLFFGGSTVPALNALGIQLGKEYPPDALSATEGNELRDICLWVDRRILSPLLIGEFVHRPEDPEDVEHVLRLATTDRLSSSAPNLRAWVERNEDQDEPGSPNSRRALSS